MPRLLALLAVFAGIWWLWRRWQGAAVNPPQEQHSAPQKLAQCQRCDAMLPSDATDRQEVARSCEHGQRCPLHLERQ